MRAEYMIHSQVEHVLAALTPENRRVMRVCLHTGIRIGDALALRTEQLAPRMWIVEAKTGKRKQIGIPGPLLAELRKWAGVKWVFEGKDADHHRTRQAVWKDVRRAAKAFRLPQHVSPHSARKVYAVELMHKYGDMARVRRALNHSNNATTMIYAMADRLMNVKYIDND